MVLTFANERHQLVAVNDEESYLEYIDRIEALFQRFSPFFELLDDNNE